MSELQIFYHWSPLARRGRILKKGLVPGQWSRDRLWKPPYVCLAPTIQGAWSLSGGMHYDEEKAWVWDLWEVDVSDQSGYEMLPYDNGHMKEIRVYERIYKRNVWWVATRDQLKGPR